MTRLRSALALASILLVASITACSADSEPTQIEGTTRDVGVQLFQWTWDAIAAECTENLGPAGYGWVLTSPPQEHITGTEWWTHYQPVSYLIESKMGDRAQFAAMVKTCKEAGVEVYADAVINHMTGQNSPGTGWAGSEYEHYSYPGIYGPQDFHYCGTHDDDIESYRDAFQVQNCELVNLADLATEAEHVRATIVTYLEDLRSLGVAGFRIDAAKHMPAEDVAAIVAELPEGTGILQEVIRGAGEPIQPEDYMAHGDVYEFSWGRDIKGIMDGTTFRMYFRMGGGGGYAASGQAVTFVDNHDTERNGETLTYKDGWRYEFATALTLASPYGTPAVMSGFAFSARDTGAVTQSDGSLVDAQCPPDAGPTAEYADGQWVCQHRWPLIHAMVGWRSVAGTAELTDQWDAGQAIAFGREDRAFLIANRGEEPVTHTWQTQLPAGDYCDVAQDPAAGSSECVRVTITADGTLSTSVPGQSILAVHLGAKP